MFDYKVEKPTEDLAVFILRGKIGLSDAAKLRKVFWDCLTEDLVKKLVINLQAVPELDSSSISLLVATKNIATKKKSEMILVGLNAENRDLLERTNLDFYFDIRRDVQEGLLKERPMPMREPNKLKGGRRSGRNGRRPRLSHRGE